MIQLERSKSSRRLRWWSVVGVLLVPIMIAAGFLAATWDSTSRWGKVQAAIVNLDEPVKVSGQLVPLGRQLAGGLVEGDQGQVSESSPENFDWVISDADDAAVGLAGGRYAAVVTIPEDFSADATSYSKNDGDRAEQATIDVETSKVGGVTDAAVAEAISTAAVTALNTELAERYLDNLYLGFNQTQQGMQKSADGAGKLADGAGRLETGIGKSADGAGELADGLDQLSTGTGQLSEGLGETDAGVDQLSTGASGLHQGIKQTDTGMTKINDGVGTLERSFTEYRKGADQNAAGMKKYTDGVGSYAEAVGPYAAGVGEYADGVTSYVKGVGEFVDGIAPAADQVAAGVSGQSEAMCAQQRLTPQECAIFAAGVKAGANGTATGVQQALVDSGDPADPSPGDQLKAGGKQLKESSTKIKNGSAKLSGAGDELSSGGDQLLKGANGLADGAKKLELGVSELHDGTGKLANGTGKLTKGAKQLADGVQKLAVGTGKLDEAGKQLATGTQQSATGAEQLSTGLTKLGDGGDQLATGAQELADGLQQGADDLPTYSESDRAKLAEVASTPVATERPDGLFAAESTTTLLMALALWIGGLVSYLLIRTVPSDAFGSAKTSVRLALEGVAPGVVIGAVQAVLLSVMVTALLDLSAGGFLGLLGFGLLAAAGSAVLNHALVAWLDGVGRFLSLGVLVLSAAGALTYALPDFLTWLRPYLPITPALEGIRAIVTGGSAGSQVGVLLGWLVIGAAASVIAIARRRMAPAP
jgi:putative membrane protein